MEDRVTLAQALAFLHETVAPRAQEIDHSIDAIRETLAAMCGQGLMALKRPEAYGGPDMPESEFRVFQVESARASGAFAFLQTQHQSAVALMSRSDNEELKREYLPKMATGERLVGIGFSQLRRPGDPIMRAEERDSSYVLNGHVPWCTGFGFYPEFLIGAQLPDGRALFAVVPLLSQPGVTVSEPMKLAAMETAQTVTIDFDNFVVPAEKVAFIREQGWIQNNDRINVALQGQFAIGCARAALDVIAENRDRRSTQFLVTTYEALKVQVDRAQDLLEGFVGVTSEESTPARLAARVEAINVMQRCAFAAVASSSGAANYLSHPAQRILRESLVFTVSAQTGPVMEGTLSRLT
jgi:alkylation response protein AidB-like acyl-CoA dehydrogenase